MTVGFTVVVVVVVDGFTRVDPNNNNNGLDFVSALQGSQSASH